MRISTVRCLFLLILSIATSGCRGGPWTVVVVDAAGNVGRQPSMTITSPWRYGDPRSSRLLAYEDVSGGAVKVATVGSAGWTPRRLAGDGARFPAVALGVQSQERYVVFGQGSTLFLAWPGAPDACPGGAAPEWRCETIRTGGSLSVQPAIAVEPRYPSRVHVVYRRAQDGLWHSFREQGGTWTHLRVGASVANPESQAMQGSQLNLVMARPLTEWNLGLVYLREIGAAFHVRSTMFGKDAFGERWSSPDVGLRDGQYSVSATVTDVRGWQFDRRIVAALGCKGALFFRRSQDNRVTSWEPIVRAPLPEAERPCSPSVSVDSLGTANIFYQDEHTKELRLARYAPGPQQWMFDLIDSDGNVGSQSATIYDPERHLVEVAYYDATNGDLKLASHTPAGDPPNP